MRTVYLFLAVFALTLLGWILWFSVGNKSEWLVYTLVIWNWFIGPLLTILLGRDAKDVLDFENPSGPHWALVRIFVSTPLGCFGVVSILIGLALAYVLFHELVIERNPEALKSIPAIGVIGTCLFFGGALVYRALKRMGPTRKDCEALEARRVELLNNPDWDFYTHHLGRPVPDLLREYYGKPEIFMVPLNEDESANVIWSGIHPEEMWDFDGATDDEKFLPFAEFLDAEGFLVLIPGLDNPNQIFFLDPFLEHGKNLIPLFDSPQDFFESIKPED